MKKIIKAFSVYTFSAIVGGVLSTAIYFKDMETLWIGVLGGVLVLPATAMLLTPLFTNITPRLSLKLFWLVGLMEFGYFAWAYHDAFQSGYGDGSSALAFALCVILMGALLLPHLVFVFGAGVKNKK